MSVCVWFWLVHHVLLCAKVPLPEKALYDRLRYKRPCGSDARLGKPEKALLSRSRTRRPRGSDAKLGKPEKAL